MQHSEQGQVHYSNAGTLPSGVQGILPDPNVGDISHAPLLKWETRLQSFLVGYSAAISS